MPRVAMRRVAQKRQRVGSTANPNWYTYAMVLAMGVATRTDEREEVVAATASWRATPVDLEAIFRSYKWFDPSNYVSDPSDRRLSSCSVLECAMISKELMKMHRWC